MKFYFALICLVVAIFVLESAAGFPEKANSAEVFEGTGERECGGSGQRCSGDSCCSTHTCICSLIGSNCRCKRKLFGGR
uniref:U12-Deinotoxin-Dsu1a_1 n=1 Tax=Deinopis subrufa TaxID=1905329 RepID=A0A4Q8K123_DEISU